MRSSHQKRPCMWSFQSWGDELHWQALTHPEEEAAASFGSEGLEPQEGRPLMADLMAGPNAPSQRPSLVVAGVV